MASIEADNAKTVTCKLPKAMVFDKLIDTRNLGQRTGPHGFH
jgi:hypothetical protein